MSISHPILFLFSEVANGKKTVSSLIEILINKENSYEINPEEKFAYQAFCCALLAKQEKSWLQKGQYINEYGSFIKKSLSINPECLIARLIRLMVERELTNVTFTNHIDIDLSFLHSISKSIEDENIKELIEKVLRYETNKISDSIIRT